MHVLAVLLFAGREEEMYIDRAHFPLRPQAGLNFPSFTLKIPSLSRILSRKQLLA